MEAEMADKLSELEALEKEHMTLKQRVEILEVGGWPGWLRLVVGWGVGWLVVRWARVAELEGLRENAALVVRCVRLCC